MCYMCCGAHCHAVHMHGSTAHAHVLDRYDDAIQQMVVNIGLALAGKKIEPRSDEHR